MIKRIGTFLFEGRSTFNMLCCMLWGLLLMDYIAAVIRRVVRVDTTTYIVVPLIIIALVGALPAIIKRLKVTDYLFYMLCICIYLMQFSLYPENAIPLDKFVLQCCLTVFPFYLFGKMVDIPKMLNAFYYVSVATIGISVFYFLIYRRGSSTLSADDYNMAAAYDLLPHVLLVTWMAIRRFTPVRIGIAFVGIMLLLTFGTRGPLLCLGVPVIIYILFRYKGKHAKAIRISFVALLAALVMLIIPLANYLQDIFTQLDVSTRILEKVLNNDIGNDSGRGELIRQLNRHLLSEHRFFGYGLFGSYRFIGGYPHNIFYELIFSFGFAAGGLLIAAMLWHFIRGYRLASSDVLKDFILIFTLMELTHLCLSYTFLTEQMFFLLLGLCAQRTNIEPDKRHNIRQTALRQ